jgi:hypothetical protein
MDLALFWWDPETLRYRIVVEIARGSFDGEEVRN